MIDHIYFMWFMVEDYFIFNVIDRSLSLWFVIGISELSVIQDWSSTYCVMNPYTCVICDSLRDPVEYVSWINLLNSK